MAITWVNKLPIISNNYTLPMPFNVYRECSQAETGPEQLAWRTQRLRPREEAFQPEVRKRFNQRKSQ